MNGTDYPFGCGERWERYELARKMLTHCDRDEARRLLNDSASLLAVVKVREPNGNITLETAIIGDSPDRDQYDAVTLTPRLFSSAFRFIAESHGVTL